MRSVTSAFVLTVLLLAPPSLAQTSAELMTAREIAKRGIQAYDAGDYQKAVDKLGQAFSVVQVPTIALYRARALAKLGRLVEASEAYREASILKVDKGQEDRQKQAQEDARAEREKLLPRVPTLSVVVAGVPRDDVTFLVDDEEVSAVLLSAGYALDPGQHKVVGRGDEQEVTATVMLEEGDHEKVRLVFDTGKTANRGAVQGPADGDHASRTQMAAEEDTQAGRRGWQRPVGFAALGVGAAGLVVGVVAGFGVKSKRDDLLAHGCDQDGACFADQDDEVSAYNRSLHLTNGALIAGGVLAAAGLTLVVTAPKRQQEARQVIPWVGVGSAGVRGRF